MDLQDAYDVIIVGTGTVESLLAGACARAGRTVLHLDTHTHYGSRAASFTLKDFAAWLGAGSAATVPDGAPDAAALGNLELVRVEHVSDAPRDVHIFGDGGVDSAPPAELLAESHRFSIDLTPQLLLCGGEMVDALRTSGVASYLEFKPVHAHLFAPGAACADYA